MHASINCPITPNKFRNLKRHARTARSEYITSRRIAISAFAAVRSAPDEYAKRRAEYAADDALTSCWLARKDYHGMLLLVRTAKVEVGAAWSPRGLANVRRSNATR